MASLRVIAVVGGIAERFSHRLEVDGELRVFSSSRHGGCGQLRRLLASLRSGGTDEVWIITCWIGHSQSRALVRECRKLGIPLKRFSGPGRLPLKPG